MVVRQMMMRIFVVIGFDFEVVMISTTVMEKKKPMQLVVVDFEEEEQAKAAVVVEEEAEVQIAAVDYHHCDHQTHYSDYCQISSFYPFCLLFHSCLSLQKIYWQIILDLFVAGDDSLAHPW